MPSDFAVGEGIRPPHYRKADYRTAIVSTALVLLGVYVATTPRSVVPIGIDSAKFAYMGRILGVPHSPGYPLYLLVSWLLSWVPLGSLAFRMNLLSACFGSLTAALASAICMELGTTAVIAGITGVLLGVGRLFWSQAIIAEVYTLHTSLIAAMTLALLVWQRSGNVRWLYVAALCLGLGMAHHTDIAVFVPAVIAFVAVADASVFRRPSIVIRASLSAIAPLSLYAYVIVRTRQGAEYVEAGARTLGELIDVVRGRQFGERLFTTGLAEAVRSRTVWCGGWLVGELGPIGCALTVVGAAVLWRRNRSMAAFVLLGTSGVMAFVLSYSTPDLEVFLLPIFVLCWICVGVALDAATRVRSDGYPALAMVAALWPCWLVVSNVAVNDLHATPAARYFDAMFARFGPGAVIVQPDIAAAHMVLYKVLGERATSFQPTTLATWSTHGGREFSIVSSTATHPVVAGDDGLFDRLVGEGRNVFAFSEIGESFRAHGFGIEPLRVADLRLEEVLSGVDRHAIVAVAVPASLAAAVVRTSSHWRRAIGTTPPAVRPAECYAFIAGRDIRSRQSAASPTVDVQLERGTPIDGSTLQATIAARCDQTSAEVVVDERVVSRVDSSIAVVVLDQRGRVVKEMTADGATLRIPFDWTALSTYRVATPRTCAPLTAQWVDVETEATQAALAVHVGRRAIVQLQMDSQSPLRVRIPGPNNADVSIRLDPPREGSSRPEIHLDASSNATDSVVDIVLGGLPVAAQARQVRGNNSEVCSLTLGNYPMLAGAVGGFERMLMDNRRDELFGPGWYAFEDDRAGGFRWTAASNAHVLVPFAQARLVDVRIDARLPAGVESVALVVNGKPLATRSGLPGWGVYRWRIPAHTLTRGVNDFVIRTPGVVSVPPDPRPLGVCVREIDFKWAD